MLGREGPEGEGSGPNELDDGRIPRIDGQRHDPRPAAAGCALHRGGARGKGQGGPGRRSTVGARGMGAARSSTRPGRIARGAGEDTGGGSRTDPVRADAGLAVHVLPGGGVHHGRRSRGDATDGVARTAVWRRAPLQLRGLRGPGSAPRLRHQRLRRDAAGPVRVGRQAARRQLRGRRSGARLRRSPPAGDQPQGLAVPTARRWLRSPRCG